MSDALTGLVELYPPLDFRQAAQRQAIVILGGGGQRAFAPEYGGPAAEPLLLERLSYGAYIAKKTGLPVLITGNSLEAARCTIRCSGILELSRAGSMIRGLRHISKCAQLRADTNAAERASHHLGDPRHPHAACHAGVSPPPASTSCAAPVGMLAARDIGVLKYLPAPEALLRSYAAIYELIGEPVRIFFPPAICGGTETALRN